MAQNVKRFACVATLACFPKIPYREGYITDLNTRARMKCPCSWFLSLVNGEGVFLPINVFQSILKPPRYSKKFVAVFNLLVYT